MASVTTKVLRNSNGKKLRAKRQKVGKLFHTSWDFLKTCHGFEINAEMKPNKRTREALKHLKTHDCFIWEGDDGPEDYETISQLVEILGDLCGRVIRLNTYSITQMELGHESSGKFCALKE